MAQEKLEDNFTINTEGKSQIKYQVAKLNSIKKIHQVVFIPESKMVQHQEICYVNSPHYQTKHKNHTMISLHVENKISKSVILICDFSKETSLENKD